MRKRIGIISLIVILLSWGIITQYPKLYIATGYGAKCLASGVFLAGRDPQKVIEQDLNFSIIRYTSSKIDYEKKMVSTSFWGYFTQSAIYREGLGCCLINNTPLDSLMKKRFSLPGHDSDAVSKIPWPNGDRVKDTLFLELNKSRLDSTINSAFDEEKRTAAVVVVYKGEMVGEKYWKEKGINQDTRLWGWSMNKSIVNALLGILVKKGKINVNESAPVPEWMADQRRNITISELMRMSSGLKWDESYGSASDATNMLFRQSDSYKSSISAPFSKEPDLIWMYSSGTANILSGLIRNTIKNDRDYYMFPYEELFYKTGMYSMVLEADGAGTFVGASYGYANARDWARFGLLYYRNGVWNGDTILPKGWVDFTRTPAKASGGKYGALFWLNHAHQLKDAPVDTYSCQGHRGQRVFIIPSRNLIVVRLGFSQENFNQNEFLKEILSCFN
jgi:CubicO group peptidase (beta-lactamase class C family)